MNPDGEAARAGGLPFFSSGCQQRNIGMPGMDGMEFIGKLRGMPAMKSVICIAVSGFGQQADVSAAEDAGFDAHLKNR
ncbi:hypothetical protein [Paraburkholderia sp. UYCP14C]|uniref:hypothetical protein n=1 Tax=Paraburkholderia sp. UYCP14C TaxID=2511130 RepID=UPI0020071A88|nr:hypothetical protein [Paraburkholderia sp. UYCP14C]